jgi:HK97 family phage portal protein
VIVQSFGALQAMTDPAPNWGPSSGGSLNLYGLSQAYGEIYRTQPNVRICVDFLARNIAQLGKPVYRRVSDTDRVRLNDHDLGKWLSHPNPATTSYRLIEDLMTDLGIYFRAYWAKVRYQAGDGRDAIGLVRLPPDEVTVEGTLIPTEFIWTVNGKEQKFKPSEIVHFSGYKLGISPLETLRRILAEESAAGAYRESLWSHGAKHEGIWERGVDTPNYTDPQIASWREQWQEFATNAKAGMTAVGQKGWKYVQGSFSAKDSEYIQGGKLRREVCAAQYHIPQPLVGILEHATFSNVKEQHKHLYADTLGPWNEMIVQEIERQLLIECDDQDRVYLEFNIDAKLAGTPEERASSLQLAVGRPWRTVNEARALENLPRIDDPKMDTVAPQQGGPASTSDADPADPDADADDPLDEEETAEAVATAIQSTQARQRSRLEKLDASERAEAFRADLSRWNRELARDLEPHVGADQAFALAHRTNARTLAQLETEEAHV